MNDLHRLSGYQTVSISPENITGEKGKGGAIPLELGTARVAARDLGTGWKVNPYFRLPAGETLTMANVSDCGEIRHIWITDRGPWRGQILRIYWDGSDTPAVECPLGDFFACGLNEYSPVVSIPVCVNPGQAFNCYWAMPFRKGFRITLENRNAQDTAVFYQITYVRKPVEEDAGYFHAQFRQSKPGGENEDFIMLDNVQGRGQYVGTYMTWGTHNNGWWGEGEVKIYIDDDKEYPSVCYTGTEDYFCGSHNFENQKTHQYQEFTTPYSGLCQVIRPDGLYRSQMRFGMYRWHITDPVCFEKNIKVTIQKIGWRSGGRYLPLRDDLSCVAFFYNEAPFCDLPKLSTADELELV